MERDINVIENDINNVAINILQEDISIEVAAVITFGIDKEHFKWSMTAEDTNIQTYNLITTKDPTYNAYQIPVGYILYNASKKDINNVVVPNYTYNQEKGLYIGKEELITFKSNDFISLPTRYVLLFLMMHNKNGLKINNGEFTILEKLALKNTNIKDYDNFIMSNFKFKPNSIWSTYFENLCAYKIIGVHRIDKTSGLYIEFTMEFQEDKQRFGYLLNPLQTGQLNPEIPLKDIDNSIKFLATLMWKKEIK